MRIRRIFAGLAIAVALAAVTVPVAAQDRDTPPNNILIPAAQRSCSFSSFSFTAGSGDVVDPALVVSHNNGAASRIWILQYSAEAVVSIAGNRINLHWRIDGGGPVILGPEFFAGDTIFQTRTALGLVTLGAGGHSVRPSYQYVGGGTGTVFFRCLTAEARTK